MRRVFADGSPLSARELACLRLRVAGRPRHEIATTLAVSESTVKAHLMHAYQKLGFGGTGTKAAGDAALKAAAFGRADGWLEREGDGMGLALGTNLCNVQYSAWPTGAVDAIAALQPTALLFYAYSARIGASQGHADDLKRLMGKLPALPLVLLRIAGDMTPQDPLGRAEEAVARWHAVGLRTAHLTTHCEWNLSAEAPSKPLAQWVTWWERHLMRLAELLPDTPRHLAALSPGVPDYLRWYEALAGSAVIRQLVDVVDIHAYDEGTLVSATEVVTGLFPASGVCLSEFNRVLPSRVAVLAPTLDAALWFIAAGTGDHAQYDLLRLPAERQDFIATIRGETMPDTTLPFDPKKVYEFAHWQIAAANNLVAGHQGDDPRDGAAFLKHLTALGADASKPTEYGLPFPKV